MRVDPAAALWCIIIADGLNHGKSQGEIVRISPAAATSRLVMGRAEVKSCAFTQPQRYLWVITGGSNPRKSQGEINCV